MWRLIGPILIGCVVVSWVTTGGWVFAIQVATVLALVILASIVVHEAGHAVVGALAGHRVVRVVNGRGPRLLATTIGRTEIEGRRSSPRGGDSGGSPTTGESWVSTSKGSCGDGTTGNFLVNLLPYGGTDGATMLWLLKSSSSDVDDLGDRLAAAEAGFHAMDGDTDRALAASEGVDATSGNSAAVATRTRGASSGSVAGHTGTGPGRARPVPGGAGDCRGGAVDGRGTAG